MIKVVIRHDDCLKIWDRWVNHNQEMYVPEKQLFWIPTEDLFRLRKLKRTRGNSLRGSANLDYVSYGNKKKRFKNERSDEYVDGQTKWDDLIESMCKYGWLPSHPSLIVVSNKRNKPKIRDGHHRLGVAMELGIKEIPVKMHYVWQDNYD